MPFIKTGVRDLMVFEPVVHGDERGYFFESYNRRVFSPEAEIEFVQDNQAMSGYGVIRGLHYQNNPYAQTKLIRVLQGAILDVAVDLRKGSPDYGKVFCIELTGENKKQLLVPKGFAHGYSVLSATAEVFYKVDQFYDKASEGGLAFNDPFLNIDWKVPQDQRLLSPKDLLHPILATCMHNFVYNDQTS